MASVINAWADEACYGISNDAFLRCQKIKCNILWKSYKLNLFPDINASLRPKPSKHTAHGGRGNVGDGGRGGKDTAHKDQKNLNFEEHNVRELRRDQIFSRKSSNATGCMVVSIGQCSMQSWRNTATMFSLALTTTDASARAHTSLPRLIKPTLSFERSIPSKVQRKQGHQHPGFSFRWVEPNKLPLPPSNLKPPNPRPSYPLQSSNLPQSN